MSAVILKKGRDKSVRQGHPWIFSGAVDKMPPCERGELLEIHSSSGEWLAWGYFNPQSNIIGRVLSHSQKNPLESLKEKMVAAINFRKQFLCLPHTNCYRLINAEGDGLPGLIVDAYDKHLVVQISTAGMERLKEHLIEYLCSIFEPVSIWEKSLLPARKAEGLAQVAGQLYGTTPLEVRVIENGVTFLVDLQHGQKTGLFLDQRQMRQWVKHHAAGKRVLNCFAYTGGFSLFAAEAHASRVDSVDISKDAMERAEKNAAANGFSNMHFYAADVFDFLRQQTLDYDLVILDPPAFAKSKKDIVSACRGYKEINRTAMQGMPPASLLLTCSCSHHIDSTLFQQVIFQAACEAGRDVRIIGRHQMAEDHPVHLNHPEGDYLKSLCLFIE